MIESGYTYYILKERWLARLQKGSHCLEPKEFYKAGKWEYDEKLNLMLNDCFIDFNDSRWYEYDEISKDEATAFVNQSKE